MNTLLKRAKTRLGQRRTINDLRRDRSGLSAIEFAFVAGPFFMLLVGIFEICLIFLVSTILEYGAREAARDVRTGALQASTAVVADQKIAFETEICDRMLNLFGCATSLTIDVRTSPSGFPSVQDVVPRNGDGSLDTSGFGFDAGGRDAIVVVNVYYEWGLITPIISRSMANMPDNKRLLVSSQAFRNEPF
ncbi:MAG: TadE/TadG family type IV pilus assembly protein [Pseudomonadota bacterium]